MFSGTNTGLDYFSPDRASRFLRALQFVDKFAVNGFDVVVRAAGDGGVASAIKVLSSEVSG